MKTDRFLKKIVFLAMVIAWTVSGCRSASAPVTFYTLSAIPESAGEKPNTAVRQDMVIAVGPARFPGFLDRPQIVTRPEANRLTISEFHRWGGDLDQDFLNVLAENLSIRLSTPRVVIYPWKDPANPDYRVSLEVHQFEGRMGDSVLLNVTWTLRGRSDDAEPFIVRRSVIRKPASGAGYDALVAAQSQALADLSGEIASAIMPLSKGK